MAEESLDFVIRMLFPSGDTSGAEASLKRLSEVAKATQATVAASSASMVAAAGAPAVAAASMPVGYPSAPGGWKGLDIFNKGKMAMQWMGPINAPNAPEPPAFWNGVATGYGGPTWAAYGYSHPAAPSRGMYGYAAAPGYAPAASSVRYANPSRTASDPMPPGGTYGWAHGPVSDPGSWAAASQSSAGGYAAAMSAAEFDASKLETYAQGLQKLRTGMSQVRESTTGLAASIILLNKAFQEGSGFDNPWTMAIGGIGAASHGLNLAHGLGRGLKGGATMGAHVARNMGWGGTAGQLGGFAAMTGGGMAALVGIPAAITAGAFYLAPGGFRETWAEQDRQDAIGAGLDRRRGAFWDERTRRQMSGISNIGYVASGIGADATADYMRFQGGAVTASTCC